VGRLVCEWRLRCDCQSLGSTAVESILVTIAPCNLLGTNCEFFNAFATTIVSRTVPALTHTRPLTPTAISNGTLAPSASRTGQLFDNRLRQTH
jgi:hypothetical protein